mgnify:CR=1 FL=1
MIGYWAISQKRGDNMIYQEINLPVWAQLVLMAFWLLALVLLLYIKPREDVKQETKETTRRPRQRAIRSLHST